MHLIVGILLGLTAISAIWLGFKARKGLERRPYWGVRTPATMASDEAFAAANRAVWWIFELQGILFGLAAAGSVYLQLSKTGSFGTALLAMVLLSTLLITFVVQTIWGNVVAKKVLRQSN